MVSRFLKSIRSRFLGIALLSVIPAIFFGVGIFLIQYHAIRTSAEHDLRSLLDATEVYHLAQYDLAHQALTFLSSQAYRDTLKPSCDQNLSEFLANQDLFFNFFITDLSGTIVCSAMPANESISIADNAYFTEALQKNDFSVSEYEIDHIANVPVLVFAHPYSDPDGAIGGIVGASLNVSALAQIVKTTDLFEGASIIVADQMGTIIMEYNNGPVGTLIDPTLHDFANLPENGFLQATGSDGVERLFSYTYTGNAHELMAVSMPVENIRQQERVLISRAILLMLLIIAGVLIFGWFGSNTLVLHHLQALIDVVRRIGNGDLKARYKKSRWGGEFDEFGKAINAMAVQLQEAHDRDIQRMAQLHNALQDLRKFKYAVANSSDHIIITDSDGKIIFANQGVERITGYSPEEVIGKTPRVWGAQMSPEFYKKFWHTIKDEKKVFTGEIQNRRKDGQLYTAATSVTPILDEKGNVEFFVGVEHDITEQKQLEEAKTEFLSIAAHQLRTPVSAIRWLIESVQHSLGKAHLSEKQTEYINDMYIMAERLAKLVEDLLNISRLETGRYSIEAEPYDLKDLVQESVKELQGYAAEHDHTLTSTLSQKPLRVAVASNLVNTALSNLVSNAVDYSPKGTMVKVDLGQEGQFAKITVSNTGPAIPPAEQGKLFTKFYRGEKGKKTNPEGSGLGLYVVKLFIEKMGGTVGLSSNDKETTFWFTIPLS